jgi:hypothetical protein
MTIFWGIKVKYRIVMEEIPILQIKGLPKVHFEAPSSEFKNIVFP